MARIVADTLADHFECSVDEAVYHGRTGPLSGLPI